MQRSSLLSTGFRGINSRIPKSESLALISGIDMAPPSGMPGSKSSEYSFIHQVRDWEKIYSRFGSEGLESRGSNKFLTTEDRYELVVRILNGESYRKVAINNMISFSVLHQ